MNPRNTRSGRTLIFVICAINILLVAFLMFRAFGPAGKPQPLFPQLTQPDASSHEPLDEVSRRVRGEAQSARAEGDTATWPRLFARHPQVAPDQWSEETAQTLTLFLEMVPEIPDPLTRIEARERVFSRFSAAPEAAQVLINHATQVLESPEAGPAARRSALVLLFRLLLQFPPDAERPPAVDGIPATLKWAASAHPALYPVLIEGWGVLHDRGFEQEAAVLFSSDELRAVLTDPEADPHSFLNALRLAPILVPDWTAAQFRPWLDHEDSRVAGEAWKQLHRTADASTLAWLEEWQPADPALDLRRLQAIRLIDQQLEAEATAQPLPSDERGDQ